MSFVKNNAHNYEQNGTGQIAPGIKCLPCKKGNIYLFPRTHGKNLNTVVPSCNPRAGGGEDFSESHWPVKLRSSSFSGRCHCKPNKQTKEKCQKVIEEDPQCQLLLFIYIYTSDYIHDHVYIWQTCQYVYTQTDLERGERVKETNLKTIHTWINSFIICFKMNSWQENYFLVLQKMTFYLVSFCFLYLRQNTEFFFKAFRKRVALKLGEMVCHCDWLINSDFCWH